jgi:cytochrome c5
MKITTRRFIFTSCLFSLAAALLLAAGCSTSAPPAGGDSKPAAAAPGTPAVAAAGKSGAQLWAENCIRCHNIRSPSSYSDAQWDVALLHMRVRANLTAEEHHKILAFMKTAH